MADYLLLKWGTLKSWRLESAATKAVVEKYQHLKWSLSGMTEDMTDEKRECLCALIDACDGTVQNDWTGQMMTKEEAKKYVNDYGNE